MQFKQSSKMADVCYEIRGPVIEHADALEEAGHSVLRLNTGNPALFGFECPEEILQDVMRNLSRAHGYTESRGILSARRAVAQHYQERGLPDVGVDDIYLGNGVSELVSMAVQALLDDGDEVLIPAPTSRSGRRSPPWRAASPCTISATSRRTGCRTWTTSPRRSPTGPGRWSSSTPTTRPARSTRASCSTACSISPGATG